MRKGCSNAQIHDDHHMASDLGTNSSFFFFFTLSQAFFVYIQVIEWKWEEARGEGEGDKGKGELLKGLFLFPTSVVCLFFVPLFTDGFHCVLFFLSLSLSALVY